MFHANTTGNNAGYLIGTAIFSVVFVAAVFAQIYVSDSTPGLTGPPSSPRRRWARRRRLSRPFTGPRLPRRRHYPARLRAGLAHGLVFHARLDPSADRCDAAGGDFLLGDDHLFANARHSAWGLDAANAGLGFEAAPFRRRIARSLRLPTRTQISRVFLFWAAFILTRPLGATVGDLLDKSRHLGGLALSRYYASALLLAAIVALIVVLPQRAARHPSAASSA